MPDRAARGADRPDRIRLVQARAGRRRPTHGARHARLVAPAPRSPRTAIVADLVRAAGETLGCVLRPTYAEAHRWRYAQVETALQLPCLYDPALRVGAAGDWCLGARIEAAYDSGQALARALLDDLDGHA
ncbi:hypothetical protein ACRBEV_28625 [Methylobacterium phyllosphaerae]